MNNSAKKEVPESAQMEDGNPHFIDGFIEYISNSVVVKTIIKTPAANICAMSFDSGEGLSEKISSFDSFFHILEGEAEIVIDNISHFLKSGQGIIIPAHSSNYTRPHGRFKIILTTI